MNDVRFLPSNVQLFGVILKPPNPLKSDIIYVHFLNDKHCNREFKCQINFHSIVHNFAISTFARVKKMGSEGVSSTLIAKIAKDIYFQM